MTEISIDLNEEYWNSFYKTNHKHTPSQFCVCVLTEINSEAVIVELGSGNGRDSLYFANQGHITVAIDLSHQAIKSCNTELEEKCIEHAEFIQGDITNRGTIQKTFDYAREKSGGKEIIFYSRFVMHSLDAAQELAFLNLLSEFMRAGEYVYFEFRSKEDSELKKHYGGHFRRFIETEKFQQFLSEALGYEITYSMTGRGMAKFKEEDPFVSRVIARRK